MVNDILASHVIASFALDPGTVLGVGLAVMSIAISIVIWLASTRAARIAEAEETPSSYIRKVDEDAYERARRIYEAAIDQLEDELNRVNTMARELQLEVFRLNAELTRVKSKVSRDTDTGPLTGE